MGTRADFYVGRGKESEWIGSVCFDGYEIDDDVRDAETEPQYREAVARMLDNRRDGITPDNGWPWPWNDSDTTDFAYAFDDGKVYTCNWGRWTVGEIDAGKAVFPNMSHLKIKRKKEVVW